MVNRSYLWLYRNSAFHLVYLDDKAAVLVKRTPASHAYLDKHAYYELRPDTALARAQSPAEDPRREAFAAEVLRHVADVPHSIRAHHLAALVHYHAGRLQEYEMEREWVRALGAKRRLHVALP